MLTLHHRVRIHSIYIQYIDIPNIYKYFNTLKDVKAAESTHKSLSLSTIAGPTPDTVADFWQMIWDCKTPVIVMLTQPEEKGKVICL